MTRNHILRKTALAIPFAGALLVSYSTARPAQTDALQLGAAVVLAEGLPSSLDVVTLDERLAAAARREGFTVNRNVELAS